MNNDLKNLNLYILNDVNWQDLFNSTKTNSSHNSVMNHNTIIFGALK